jgi:O-antigen/teichoic acid export membrane protein
VKLFSRERLRQVVMVGGIESFGVILSGIAGLLIVNVLPKDQYAAYTFLVACTTLMMGITDLGVAHCCMPVVGQRTRDVPWVVAVCHHVFHKRWLLLSLGLVIIVPYWYFTSREHRWTGPGYWLASVVAMAGVLVTLREHNANTVLLILGKISTLNRVAFSTHAVRIAFVGLVLLLPMSSYSTAGLIAATVAASIVSLMLYMRAFRDQHIGDHRLDADTGRRVDGEIIRIAKPLILPAIFYQVQGVVTVFIVSLFGTANMVAEVGAFGRLAMALVVVDRVANILLFPAIARAQTGPRFVRVLAQVHGLYLLAMACTFMTSLLFPQYWILLLGEQYRSMTPLVWMMFLSSLLSNAAGFAFRTLTVRGATARQSFSIVATLITQVLYLWLVGISDLKSVLGFGLASSVASCVFQYAMLLARWREWRTAAPTAA